MQILYHKKCNLVPVDNAGGLTRKDGLGFMIVADFTNLVSKHVPTSKTCCRLGLIYNRIADLQQNRRFATTLNPDHGLQSRAITNLTMTATYQIFATGASYLNPSHYSFLKYPCSRN